MPHGRVFQVFKVRCGLCGGVKQLRAAHLSLTAGELFGNGYTYSEEQGWLCYGCRREGVSNSPATVLEQAMVDSTSKKIAVTDPVPSPSEVSKLYRTQQILGDAIKLRDLVRKGGGQTE